MYYLKTTFDDDFSDLLMFLKSKYGKKLFNIDGIGDQQTDFSAFSKDFFSTRTTTADISIDANSNVDTLDVIAYNIEFPKPLFKLNSYYVLHKKCKQLYGLQKASQLAEDAVTGTYYINDFHGIGGGLSYCFNYSLYDIALFGLPMVKKIKSVAPKYLYSFKSQVEQFVVIASNSTLGATGLADLALVFSLYIDKIFRNGHDANFYFPGWYTDEELQQNVGKNVDEFTIIRTEPNNKEVFEQHVWQYVKENIVSLVYTINQPMRGNQSPFTNISVYSDTFLDQMIDGYSLEGHVVNKNTIKKFQELFLDIMNHELNRTPITFPVCTACFVTDDENEIVVEDLEFLDMISEKNLDYGFINIYCGKSSTLSSCCRLRSETDNRFFSEEKFYEIELDNGDINKVSSKHALSVKNLKTGELEEKFIDEIKDDLENYEIIKFEWKTYEK